MPACGDCRGVSCNNSAGSGVAVNNAEALDFEDGNVFENLFGLKMCLKIYLFISLI